MQKRDVEWWRAANAAALDAIRTERSSFHIDAADRTAWVRRRDGEWLRYAWTPYGDIPKPSRALMSFLLKWGYRVEGD